MILDCRCFHMTEMAGLCSWVPVRNIRPECEAQFYGFESWSPGMPLTNWEKGIQCNYYLWPSITFTTLIPFISISLLVGLGLWCISSVQPHQICSVPGVFDRGPAWRCAVRQIRPPDTRVRVLFHVQPLGATCIIRTGVLAVRASQGVGWCLYRWVISFYPSGVKCGLNYPSEFLISDEPARNSNLLPYFWATWLKVHRSHNTCSKVHWHNLFIVN